MEQKIPNITNDDIKRIIERDFPKNTDIANILNRYTSETEKGRNRVHAAILKIAACSVEKIEKYVEVAIVDYRDVLYWAEYSNYSKFVLQVISAEKKSELINEDWNEYNEWLTR